MKNYEYGFYGKSGEFFELREFGFYDGRKYYLTAENAEQAYTEFLGNWISSFAAVKCSFARFRPGMT